MSDAIAALTQELADAFGEEVAAARHEIIYSALTAQGWRSKPVQALRGWAALVRDLLWLLQPGPRPRPAREAVVLVASLAGPSGLGTLQRAEAAVRQAGRSTAWLLHPRLGRQGGWPLRPALSALRPRRIVGRHPKIATSLVRAVMWRDQLWRSALARTLPTDQIRLMHCDFDLLGRASLGTGAIAIQHGMPSPEFLPPRAPVQVVWGETSRAVLGAPGITTVLDDLGRSRADRSHALKPAPPQGIALVSQTHTPVFGPGLAPRLITLAQQLARAAPTTVLLHPQERAGVYHGIADLEISRPPHRCLAAAEPPLLVVGFSSTALLDAAMAGHAVVGLDGARPATAEIGSPPLRVSDAAAVVRLFQHLRADQAARDAHARATEDWLRATFAGATGALAAWLRQHR